jgi:hypothetical protein
MKPWRWTDLRPVCQSRTAAATCTPHCAYDYAVVIEGEVDVNADPLNETRRMPGTCG